MSVRRVVVDLNGAPVSYREAGAGVAAIVTAGLGLTSRFYEESYAAFAGAGIRLIVPDLPGWGETPGPRTGLTVSDVADFLRAFAQRIGVDRAVWIGHSLGVHAVAHVAAESPARSRSIVLVGPTGAPGRFRRSRQLLGLTKEALSTTWDVRLAVAREYVRTSPVRYIGTWLRHASDDIVARASRIQCPALVLAGDADPICPPEFIELMRRRMRQARVVWVPGGTHALPRGHAQRFNREVIAFIHETALARG